MKILREKEVKTSRAHSCIRCDKRIEHWEHGFHAGSGVGSGREFTLSTGISNAGHCA